MGLEAAESGAVLHHNCRLKDTDLDAVDALQAAVAIALDSDRVDPAAVEGTVAGSVELLSGSEVSLTFVSDVVHVVTSEQETGVALAARELEERAVAASVIVGEGFARAA